MIINITLKNYTNIQTKQVNCQQQSNTDVNITLGRDKFFEK